MYSLFYTMRVWNKHSHSVFASMYGLSGVIVCVICCMLEVQDENKSLGFTVVMDTIVLIYSVK